MQDAMARVPAHVPSDRVTHIDIYNPAGPAAEPHEVEQVWRRLQRDGQSLMWTTAHGGHWIATRGGVVRTILSDHEHFSSSVLMVPRERGLSDLLPTAADPPRHRPFRALINAALSPAAIRKLEPDVRAYTRQLVRDLLPRGSADFIADFAALLPTVVFLRLAALPLSDNAMLNGWMEKVIRPEADGDQAVMMQNFSDYLKPILRERKANPGDDVLSAIAAGTIEGAPISESDAISMATTIVIGGLDTVVALMSFAMNYLARDPDLQRELASHPDRIPAAVEEFCRRFPVGVNCRAVAREVDIDGVTLKKGDLVTTPQILHALDDLEYPDAMTVDIGRAAGGYSSFGHGVHRCPGSFLGKTELRVMLEEWLAHIPSFEIAEGARITVSTGLTSGIFSLPVTWPGQAGTSGASARRIAA